MNRIYLLCLVAMLTSCSTSGQADGVFVLVKGGIYDRSIVEGLGDGKYQVKDFLISKYELSKGEWKQYLEATGQTDFFNNVSIDRGSFENIDKYSKSDDAAMPSLTFIDAILYCNWRSRNEGLREVYTISGPIPPIQTNYSSDYVMPEITYDVAADGYRLPTAIEWEWAAMGGAAGIKTRWWEKADIHEYEYSWAEGKSEIFPVSSKRANPLGLHHVFANVTERCWDETGVVNSRSGRMERARKGLQIRVLQGNDSRFVPEFFSNGYLDPLGRYYTGMRLARNAPVRQ